MAVTVNNATDTFVRQSNATQINSTSTRLGVRGSGSGLQMFTYISFSRPFPLGVTLIDGTLKLYLENPSGTPTFSLRRISEPWKVGRTNYNNRPSVSGAAVVGVAGPMYGTLREYTFDVQADLQAVADGGFWYGWRLEVDTDSNYWFRSSQAQWRKPVLEVDYHVKPDKPTDLSPRNGQAVATSHPILKYDFNDSMGSTAMSAVQIQINGTDDFATPAFDTGVVYTSEETLDLADTAYTGITEGGTAYWRVRVQDGAGLWSEWSDSEEFTRVAKGTVAITNPPANVVEEFTPPIIWSVTGATQTHWQVLVYDSEGNEIHASLKRAGAETAYTIPAKYLTRYNTNYDIEVRVWDDVFRDASQPGGAYINSRRTITVQKTTTVTPVTGLVAVGLEPTPGIELTWSRSTAPDGFTIMRDGKAIATNVDPLDVLVSGTTYKYMDRFASPRRSSTYEVHAVVNGQTSATNPSATGISRPVGIWLQDPERDIAVQLLGNDAGDWRMGEIAGVHEPVGGTRVVRVTQALRGYEGKIEGVILANEDRTIVEQEADMWDLKETVGRTYLLSLSDLTIPVIIGNVTVAPTPRAEIEKRVAFDFWQVDDVPFSMVQAK